VIVGVTFAVFLTLWGTVVVGQRVLVGGDVLYQYQPWAGEAAARAPRNTYVGDPVTQFVEWTGLVKDSFARGEMPLWNPYTLSGTPLLANDQSSPFSPFTLLSLLFQPARGVSLAMLLKLWVAGIGMAVFVRLHGARAPAAALAGIAYATSSFMVVWLAYPHTAVAATMPWAFAAVAWYLRDPKSSSSRFAILAIAAAVAVQFLAGHAETSLHLGVGLAVYAAVRVIGLKERRGRAVLGLATGAVLGSLLAGAQLVPFVANLTDASILSDRSDDKTGFAHLEWRKLDSWIVPNGEGSPGIDGVSSRFPVYPESVGFAGAGAFVLALTAVGLVRDRQLRWRVLALLAVVGVSAGTVYGPLSPLVGRTPMLDVSNNIRFLTVLCFAVAALAGLGLDRLLTREPRSRSEGASRALLGLGGVATAALALGLAAVVFREDTLRDVLPEVDGRIGFWVATGVAAVVAAAAFYGARRTGARASVVAGGFVAVALLEAVLFAWPYNPRVPVAQSPPASATIDWLRANVGGGSVAAAGLELIPNVASAYRLRDPRGVDTLLNPRLRTYWSKADPGFDDSFLYTVLSQPDVRWLAAAGVTHYLTPADKVLAGTIPAFFGSGATVAEVPGARPFVFAAPSTITVSDQDVAAETMAADPLGSVVVERPPAETSEGVTPAGPAAIEMLRDRAQVLTVRVTATTATTLVVLQSFADGWKAEVDGERARIDPADVLFQSVQVPAGTHTVTFRYQPESFRLGMAATAAGLIGAVLLGIAPLLSRSIPRRRTPAPRAVN
jgi:hypothetical protein